MYHLVQARYSKYYKGSTEKFSTQPRAMSCICYSTKSSRSSIYLMYWFTNYFNLLWGSQPSSSPTGSVTKIFKNSSTWTDQSYYISKNFKMLPRSFFITPSKQPPSPNSLVLVRLRTFFPIPLIHWGNWFSMNGFSKSLKKMFKMVWSNIFSNNEKIIAYSIYFYTHKNIFIKINQEYFKVYVSQSAQSQNKDQYPKVYTHKVFFFFKF